MTLVQPFIRSRTTWLAYLMITFYGYFLNIFGPITPFLKNEFDLSYTVSSLHFSAFALGMIGTGLTGHRIIQQLGRGQSLWIGALGMCLSAVVLVAGRSPVLTIGASFVMGLIGTLILAIVPSMLSDEHGEKRAVAISEANVVGSLISTVAPVLVGLFASTVFGWRAALMVGVVAAVVMRCAFGRVYIPERSATDAHMNSKPLPIRYWIYWLAIVVVVSVEFCMIFWSADYLEVELGISRAGAAQAISLFLGGMIIGRLVSSRLVQQFSAHQVVTTSLLIAAVGFMLYWTATAPFLGIGGLFITGLGVSCLYPLILSLAMGSANSSSDRASAASSLASGTAIFFLPLILGRLADAMGIRSAYAIIVLLLVIAFVIIQGTARKATVESVTQ